MHVYGKNEGFIMQMLYVCVLCTSCGSSQCCVLHDLQFVNAGRGCKRRPYGRGILHGSKRHSLHAVELSQRSGKPCANSVDPTRSSNGSPITVLGKRPCGPA